MGAHARQGLALANELTAEELRQVVALKQRCDALEGLTLKLNMTHGSDGMPANKYLYFVNGAIVGYCALDGGAPEAELCGMVHPDFRLQGIGRALLAAMIEHSRRHGIRQELLICEAASASGRQFVASFGYPLSFSELHLEMRVTPLTATGPSRLTVRQATASDIDAVTRITVGAFGGVEERTRLHIAQELEEPGSHFYLGLVGATPVTSLKVYPANGRAGIYAFGVLPAERGKGYGKEMLTTTMELLRAEGYPQMFLEVDDDNTVAQRLYAGCGFRETTTYGYYTIQL